MQSTLDFDDLSFTIQDLPLRKLPFVALDVETTGYAPPQARITEIAIVRLENGKTEEFSSLINPEVPIPPQIVQITGIHDGMVRDQPVLGEVFPTIARLLENAILVTHNVPFDFAFLDQAFKDIAGRPLEMPSMCTLKLSRKYLGLRSNNLGSVAAHLGIDLRQAHRAMADTKAVVGILEKFLTRFEGMGIRTGGDLIKLNHLKLHRPER